MVLLLMLLILMMVMAHTSILHNTVGTIKMAELFCKVPLICFDLTLSYLHVGIVNTRTGIIILSCQLKMEIYKDAMMSCKSKWKTGRKKTKKNCSTTHIYEYNIYTYACNQQSHCEKAMLFHFSSFIGQSHLLYMLR